jgi:hypothetical protein
MFVDLCPYFLEAVFVVIGNNGVYELHFGAAGGIHFEGDLYVCALRGREEASAGTNAETICVIDSDLQTISKFVL